MKVFHKKAFKDFRKFGWRSILIILILILSIGGSLGFIYVSLAADPWIESYFDNVNHADYIYQLEESTWINQSVLDGLSNQEEVEDYTGRLFWKSSLKLEGQNEVKYILLVGLDPLVEVPKVFNYAIESGSNFNQNNNNLSIVIDSDFAVRNSLIKGDILNLSGLADAELNISGFCNSPEFLMMTSNPEYSIPIKGSIAVGYLSKETLKNYIIQYFEALNASSPVDMTPMIYYYKNVDYNNIAVTFEETVDVSAGNTVVESYLEDDLNIIIETADFFKDLRAYDEFHGNIQDAKQFTLIILIFMLLMGFFITFVIFSRYVYNQKQQIGTLMTFGYRKPDITQYFLRIFLLILVITIPLSIIIGYTVGWAILGAVVSNVANLSVSKLAFMFIPEIIYLGIGLVLLITFISLYLPVISVKRTSVSDLVYGQSKTKFSVIRLRKSLKPKKKISNNLIHRNLFRHKKRLLFTTIAMTFSLLIISATQTIVDSMDYNVSRVFKSDNSSVQTNENWDLNVNFQNSINMSYANNTADLVSEIQNIKEIQSYVKGLVTALGNEDQMFLLIGFQVENSTVHHFTWDNEQSGSTLPTNENEIVISRQHSVKLNKKVGDEINITTPTDDNFTMS
jgi:ABC-type lipoprotein release transport system permease subunit